MTMPKTTRQRTKKMAYGSGDGKLTRTPAESLSLFVWESFGKSSFSKMWSQNLFVLTNYLQSFIIQAASERRHSQYYTCTRIKHNPASIRNEAQPVVNL